MLNKRNKKEKKIHARIEASTTCKNKQGSMLNNRHLY